MTEPMWHVSQEGLKVLLDLLEAAEAGKRGLGEEIRAARAMWPKEGTMPLPGQK